MSETEIWQSVYSYGRNSQRRKDALVSSRWRAIESGVSDGRGQQGVGIPTPGALLQKFRVSAAGVRCQPHLVISDTTQFSWRDRFKHPRKRGGTRKRGANFVGSSFFVPIFLGVLGQYLRPAASAPLSRVDNIGPRSTIAGFSGPDLSASFTVWQTEPCRDRCSYSEPQGVV